MNNKNVSIMELNKILRIKKENTLPWQHDWYVKDKSTKIQQIGSSWKL
jgi:hypothetical protein